MNFSRALISHEISILVIQQTIGKVLSRRRIVKKSYTITLAMVYLEHDPRWWNRKMSMNPKVESWYVNFLGALLMDMIFIWVTLEDVKKISPRSTIVKMPYTMPLDTLYTQHDPRRWHVHSFMNPEVCQLLDGITFTYNLYLGCSMDCRKGFT